MTLSDYKTRLKIFTENLVRNNRPFAAAVQTVTQEIGNRIFVEGKNSSGGNIGQYDTTTPLYINPKTSPRAGANKVKGIEGLNPPTGKTGKTNFTDGKPHKTTWVKNYKEFRNRIGRRVDKVDLVLSGDLQSDWRNQKSLDLPANAIKINANEYHITLKREINSKKIEGLENRFGQISKVTKNERNRLQTIAIAALLNDMQKAGL